MVATSALDHRQDAVGRAATMGQSVRSTANAIGYGPKWSSRSAISNGRPMGCFGMASKWGDHNEGCHMGS
jgi:hypothetical protein